MLKINEIDRLVGGRLRARRAHLGVEHTALADALKIAHDRIHAFEAGVERIGAELLLEICRELKVGAEFFFEPMVALRVEETPR